MRVLSTFLCTLLASSSLAEASRRLKSRPNGHGSQMAHVKRSLNTTTNCVAAPADNAITAPYANVWHDLTEDEAAAVTAFLFADRSLNLTPAVNATAWSNTVLLVELLQPNKSDVLAYIDTNSSAPTRYAHAVLDVRSVEDAYVQDYIIGPLPVRNGTTTIAPLNFPYNKGIGKQRNYNSDEDLRIEWLNEFAATIVDITMDLWGIEIRGLDNDTGVIWGIDPLWQEDGRIISWDQIWNNPTTYFDTLTILPLGFFIKSDVTGRDPAEWKITGLLYNDIFYETIDDFRKAWNSTGFVKNGPNVDGDWGHSDRRGPELPRDDIYPPVTVAPEGPRFGLDMEQKYVEWMDFSFFLIFTRDTGLRLFDVKYKGERIIYELGLQEALAHYGGIDPQQSGTAYLDSWYGFGPFAFELTAGFDCPTYATFLNTTFYVEETTHDHLNSICIFEQDSNFPISRHTNSRYTFGNKNIFLTVRTISSVGNYDYMFDYTFYLDGSIGVDVRASGYIQSAYFAHNGDYGFKIHDNLSGSMHDHVLNWKLDLDVLGTKNTLTTTEVVPTQETYSWSGGKVHNTMKLKRGEITNEDQGKINWSPNGAVMYTVINKEEKNKYGEYRGWRVAPNSGNMIYLTVQNSTNLNQAAEWSSHNLFVTKQKDTEPRSAHPYNNVDTLSPVVNFAKFFDSEDIEQEDIVLWFNLGMHHVPHTGDLPNTVFTTAHSGLIIEPQNYLLGSPAVQAKHQVRITYSNGTVSDVAQFGVTAPTCSADLSSVEADYWQYHGDVVVRKFPYDPVNWYYDTDSIT